MSIAEKLQTIAENEQRVYEAGKAKGKADGITEGYINGKTDGYAEGKADGFNVGYESGKADGITEGIEEGKDAEYNRFWDDALKAAAVGDFAFAGPFWTDKAFDPPRGTVIQPKRAVYMFANAYITDLVTLCEEKEITIDFSKSTSLMYTFYGAYGAKFTRIGVVNTTGINTLYGTFYSQSKLHTIVKIILKEDGSQAFNTPFNGCSALENLEIEGTIGQNGFNVSPCTKLSRASITSIVNALSSTTSGLTVTISKTAKEAAFTDAEWADLIATKSNWTISLN